MRTLRIWIGYCRCEVEFEGYRSDPFDLRVFANGEEITDRLSPRGWEYIHDAL